MQIFKNIIPQQNLFDYLNINCVKQKSCYEFNEYSFKKSILNNSLFVFLDIIKDYYHESKKNTYINVDNIKYKNITTIIRQICNTNKMSFCSKIKYIKNSYDIIYYIYF
jgi:hypothetical protein